MPVDDFTIVRHSTQASPFTITRPLPSGNAFQLFQAPLWERARDNDNAISSRHCRPLEFVTTQFYTATFWLLLLLQSKGFLPLNDWTKMLWTLLSSPSCSSL
ncbi:hypothetical protein OUZ56_008783 [Daphnia magna]|uniref:Uncharacterized protein n=1 Tax=Daphnia magna TaxID=35525 RepID=A0ABR0AE12_9CRUS|nr:hypothetical protein OUZ56_008783 [Daphnia magna]